MRPNILEIRIDDTPPSSFIRLARLQGLVAVAGNNWIKFSNARFEMSKCGPYRVSTWTGRQARKTGVTDEGTAASGNMKDWDSAGGWDHTVPKWVRRVGYYTACFGKSANRYPWSRGDSYIPTCWDKWACFLDDASLGGAHASHVGPQYFSTVWNQDGSFVTKGTGDPWTGAGFTSGAAANRYGLSSTPSYSSDYCNALFQTWVATEMPASRPWYVHIGTRATHRNEGSASAGNTAGTMNAASRHAGSHTSLSADDPADFNEDARRQNDASLTNGSATVTSPTIAWTSADVGAKITAVSGIPVGTSILSVQSATSATMTANATATISGTADITVSNGLGFSATHLNRKPAWLRGLRSTAFSAAERTALRNQRGVTWDCMTSIDELLYDAEQALRAHSHPDGGTQWDHTVVFFSSDNGSMEGQKRLGSNTDSFTVKGVPYEPSGSTEWWVHYPGISSRVESAVITNTDLAPTILEIAGATREATLPPDGMSFLPVIDGRLSAPNFRTHVFSEWVCPFGTGAGEGDELPSFSCVTEFANSGGTMVKSRKHIEYLGDGSGGFAAENEDYDLVGDPNELVNLARSAPYTDLAAALAKMRRL